MIYTSFEDIWARMEPKWSSNNAFICVKKKTKKKGNTAEEYNATMNYYLNQHIEIVMELPS